MESNLSIFTCGWLRFSLPNRETLKEVLKPLEKLVCKLGNGCTKFNILLFKLSLMPFKKGFVNQVN